MRFNYKTLIISAVLFSVCDNVFGDAKADYEAKIKILKGNVDDLSNYVVSSNASKAVNEAQKLVLDALEETKTYAKNQKVAMDTQDLKNIAASFADMVKSAIGQEYAFIEASEKRYTNSNLTFDPSIADKRSTASPSTAAGEADAALVAIYKAISDNRDIREHIRMADSGKTATTEKDNAQANEMYYNSFKSTLSQAASIAKSFLKGDSMTIAVSIGTTLLAAATVVSVALF